MPDRSSCAPLYLRRSLRRRSELTAQCALTTAAFATFLVDTALVRTGSVPTFAMIAAIFLMIAIPAALISWHRT